MSMGWPGCHWAAHVRRAVHHDGAVGLDALAVKGGSGDAPLTAMDLAIAGDEPFAQQNLHAPLGPLLDEVLRLVDEDLVDKCGLVDKDNVGEAQTVVGHAPVGFGQVLEERDRITRFEEAAQQIKRQIHLQARRKAIAIALQHGPLRFVARR